MAIQKITQIETMDKVNGTSLVGVVNTTYGTLVELFGEPMEGYDYKTDAEWALEFHTDTGDTVVATIYNWKNGKNYMGDQGTPVEDITRWNIGGHTSGAANLVTVAILNKIAAS